MTDDELRALVEGLDAATARNTENIDRNSRNIGRSLVYSDRYSQAIGRSASRSQDIREKMTHNTKVFADGMELLAASKRTAAEAMQLFANAMELSANTSRNLDRLEQDIAHLQQLVGIVIQDSRADRGRIRNIEDQE
jgi:hypothetical protein